MYHVDGERGITCQTLCRVKKDLGNICDGMRNLVRFDQRFSEKAMRAEKTGRLTPPPRVGTLPKRSWLINQFTPLIEVGMILT